MDILEQDTLKSQKLPVLHKTGLVLVREPDMSALPSIAS